MKYVYARKSNFVAQLSQLFSQYNMHGVANMIYMTDELPFERVVITFQGGGSTSVNVAMDSEEAMLDDILRELDRYEQDGE